MNRCKLRFNLRFFRKPFPPNVFLKLLVYFTCREKICERVHHPRKKLRLPGVIKTRSDWSIGVNNKFSSRAEFVYHHANHLATCKKVTWSRFLCIHRETCMRIVPCESIRRLISSGRARMKRFLPKTPKAFNSGEKIAIDRLLILDFNRFSMKQITIYNTPNNIHTSYRSSTRSDFGVANTCTLGSSK